MCNACGFYCCAYDGFSRCGCEHCPEPACWDEDEDDYGDDGDYDLAPRHARRFFCDSPVAVTSATDKS